MDEEKWSYVDRLEKIAQDRRRAHRAALLRRQGLSTVAAGGMGVLVGHLGDSVGILVAWLLIVPWLIVSIQDNLTQMGKVRSRPPDAPEARKR